MSVVNDMTENSKKEKVVKQDSETISQQDKTPESRAEETSIPGLPSGIPNEIRQSMFRMMFSQGPGFLHLLEKFQPEHVTTFLENMRIDSDNEYQLSKSNRNYYLLYLILFIGFLIFLIIFLLPENKDLLLLIIQMAIVTFGGIGIGSRFFSKKSSD